MFNFIHMSLDNQHGTHADATSYDQNQTLGVHHHQKEVQRIIIRIITQLLTTNSTSHLVTARKPVLVEGSRVNMLNFYLKFFYFRYVEVLLLNDFIYVL